MRMPKPKGWSSAMLARRDKIVKGLMKRKSMTESRAYAIATAIVEGRGKR